MKKILIIFASVIILFIALSVGYKYYSANEIKELRNKVCSAIPDNQDLFVEVDISKSDICTKYFEIYRKGNAQVIKKYDASGNVIAQKYNELNNPTKNEQIYVDSRKETAIVRYVDSSFTNMQVMLGIKQYAKELSDKIDYVDDAIDDPLEYFVTIDGDAPLTEYMKLPIKVRDIIFNNESCYSIEASDGVSTTQRILYVSKETYKPIGIKTYTPGVEDEIFAFKYELEGGEILDGQVQKPLLTECKVVTFADDILESDKSFEKDSERLEKLEYEGEVYSAVVPIKPSEKMDLYNITPRNDNIKIIAINNYSTYQRFKEYYTDFPEFSEKDFDNYQIDIFYRYGEMLQYDSQVLSHDKTVNYVFNAIAVDAIVEGESVPKYMTIVARPFKLVLENNLNNVNAIYKKSQITIAPEKAIEIANNSEKEIIANIPATIDGPDTSEFRLVQMRDELVNFEDKDLFYKPNPLENSFGNLLDLIVSKDPAPTCWAIYYDTFKADQQLKVGVIGYVNATTGELVGAKISR